MLKKILLVLGLMFLALGVIVQLADANHSADERSSITPPPASTPPVDLIPVPDDEAGDDDGGHVWVPPAQQNLGPVETVAPKATVPPMPTVPPPVD